MTYRKRREARAERLRDRADNHEQQADADLSRAHYMADAIPFGQPILAGHHSERRDRNYRDRIDRTTGRGVDHARKADEMRSRADTIDSQLEHGIYSDDPDAIERLEERIAILEAQRQRIKAYNASCRKAAKTGAVGDLLLLDEKERADVDTLARVAPYQLGPGRALPGYKLSNLGGNIKRNRDRLAELRDRAARSKASADAGGMLVEDLAGGACRLTFPDKPDRDVLTALKAAGFRWHGGAWFGKRADLPSEVRP